MGTRAKLLVELGRRFGQPLSRGRARPLARTQAQSDFAPVGDAALCASSAGRRARAARPDQLRLSPPARVPRGRHHVGRGARRRAAPPPCRVFLGRVRPARVVSDLFGRPRHPRRRSHQERVRPGHSARWRRPVLRAGLLPPTARHQRMAAGGVSRDGHEPAADGAGHRPQRRAHHGANRNARLGHQGQGVASPRRPMRSSAARLERRRQLTRGPRAHVAAVWR